MKHLAAVSFFLLLAPSASAQDKPNFTGTWILDVAKTSAEIVRFPVVHCTHFSGRSRETAVATGAVTDAGRRATAMPQQTVGRAADVGPAPALPVVGVSALDVVLVDDSRGDKEVELTLRNETAKAVTAWFLELEVRHPDGFIARSGIGKDGYSEYEGLYHAPEPPVVIPAAGQTRTRVRLQDRPGHPEPVVAPTVTVRAVIFADASSAGHPISVDLLFAGRQRTYDGWAIVVAALESAESNSTARDRAAAALAALDKTETERFGKTAGGPMDPTTRPRLTVQTARDQIRRGMNGTGKVPPEQVVHKILVEARSELTAVERHRRPQG